MEFPNTLPKPKIMRKFLQVGMLLFMLAPAAWAQERIISGRVTSQEDGTSLPGVNVVLRGTATGTVTDSNGAFQLAVPSSGGSIVFSFIGLQTQEVAIGDRTVIDVQLSLDVTQLGEVVVTAVGIQREKKALGYAVSDVGGDRIQQKSEPDPVRALQGKIPGVNIIGSGGAVGSGTNITIRGNKSLLGNNQPLFVVDGVPFDNTSFATGSFTAATTATNRSFDLDPNNIESMTVLKGAAAAALYGSRASNGVIVVTTKAGKKSSRKGLEITVNSSYSQEEVSNLPDYQQRYGGGNNLTHVPANFGTWGAPFDPNDPLWQLPANAVLIKGTDPVTGGILLDHPWVSAGFTTNPNASPYFPEFAGQTYEYKFNNNAKDFFQTGSLEELGISIASGNDKANFIGGVSRTWNTGIVPYNELNRTSLNFGGNAQLANGLFVGGSVTYVNINSTSPPSTGLINGTTSVTERLLFLPPNIPLKDLPYQDSKGVQAMYRPDNDNPYYLARYAPNTSQVNRYFGTFNIGYDVRDWLNVMYKAGFNGFSDSKLEVVPKTSADLPLGQLISDEIRRLELDGNFLVTITRDINPDLNLKAILGHNANKRVTNRQSFLGTGIIIPGINDFDNVQSTTPNAGIKSERSYQAAFADLSVSYKDWLFLNLTGRNDWASALPKNNRSYFYGGVSSSVILTDALNIQPDKLSFLKLRAGWARVGSDPIPYQTYNSLFFVNSSIGTNVANINFPFRGVNSQTLANTLGNANLTPEFTTELELGTDVKFFDNRLGFDVTWYDRSTTDQIVPITVSPTSGYTSAVVNLGEVQNKGWEVGLSATPVSLSNGFTWEINAAYTRNRNVVVSLAEGLEEVFLAGFANSVRVVHKVGEPYGQIKGTVAKRYSSDPNASWKDGDLLVDPATGKLITAAQEQLIGDPNPDFTLGLTNTFSWKGITLSSLIDYRHGGDMFSQTFNQVYGRGLVEGTVPDGPRGRAVSFVIPGVVGNPTTQTAVLDSEGNPQRNTTQIHSNDWWFINTFGSAGAQEFNVFDATVIRLREVSLGYELPKSWLSKTPFGSVSIQLTGRNLWFKAVNFPDDLNFDPETNSLGAGNVEGLGQFSGSTQSGNAQGVDFGIIPTTKRYGVNLRFTF
jgi:TonB-linked SusC/RagA family outer membrane protein